MHAVRLVLSRRYRQLREIAPTVHDARDANALVQRPINNLPPRVRRKPRRSIRRALKLRQLRAASPFDALYRRLVHRRPSARIDNRLQM